ncbi:MAG: glycine cleavage system protein H [Bacteroidota bacterium]
MEGSTYVDLFATKGIEYLLVIGFLAIFVLFWRYINTPIQAWVVPETAKRTIALTEGWFHLADGYFYHQGHSWAVPEGNDVVKVGIDDFAQKLLGRLNSITLPQIGEQVQQGEKGWELRIDSKSLPMLSPIDGEVLSINEEVLRSPELINLDPYGKGWLMKIKVPQMKADLKNLLSGRVAKAWIGETVNALRQRVDGSLGILLQDGGVPVPGIARNISEENWYQLAREFLMS